MSTHLHIVCLDAPSPPDYGGAIDMYYTIKTLAEMGNNISLHYFDYHPARNATGLDELCKAVYHYKRKSFFQALPLSQPFIVQSRINGQLIQRLNEDNFPVLLEGLHCAGIVPFLNNKERVVVRMHNDEASYYHHLSQTESFFFKRKYLAMESSLLKRYQRNFVKEIKLACLSETDSEAFKNDYGFQHTHFIPCFIPWQQLYITPGAGNYCLYHGNMLVSENEEAALWLLKNVFSELNIPFVIAGKGISKKLQAAAASNNSVSLVTNPTISKIDGLIQAAHINVLPSMNSTGVKLKMLNALLNGRHCITNYNGIKGSKLNDGVTIKATATEWVAAINELMGKSFSITDIEKRKSILGLYNNVQNAERLIALYSHYQ